MKSLLIPLLAGTLISSCVPSTPQARIEREPEKFSALSKPHQELAQRGEIAPGMPPDGVWFAWGAPNRAFQGSKEGATTERWDYAAAQPVHTTNFHGSYGYGGCGPYRRHGHYGFGPEVTYIPYRIASVWFLNNRVDSWERAR